MTTAKEPDRYVQKPPVVTAEQFWPKKKPWPRGVVKHPKFKEYQFGSGFGPPELVRPGDWIVTPVLPDGIRSVCSKEAFELMYESEQFNREREKALWMQRIFG